MHNKLFVADNAVAIYGGRNIADENFMKNRKANFIDMDVLSASRVVSDLSAVFDLYWNSELEWPVQTLLGRPTDAAAARLQFVDRDVEDAGSEYRRRVRSRNRIGSGSPAVGWRSGIVSAPQRSVSFIHE